MKNLMRVRPTSVEREVFKNEKYLNELFCKMDYLSIDKEHVAWEAYDRIFKRLAPKKIRHFSYHAQLLMTARILEDMGTV